MTRARILTCITAFGCGALTEIDTKIDEVNKSGENEDSDSVDKNKMNCLKDRFEMIEYYADLKVACKI